MVCCNSEGSIKFEGFSLVADIFQDCILCLPVVCLSLSGKVFLTSPRTSRACLCTLDVKMLSILLTKVCLEICPFVYKAFSFFIFSRTLVEEESSAISNFFLTFLSFSLETRNCLRGGLFRV